MANDLKVIQRKFIEQGMSLGNVPNVFGKMQGGFNIASDVLSSSASGIASESAKQKGTQLAVSMEGVPQKLAPGLTKATREYNNAYNDVTTGLLGAKLNTLLSNNLREASKPGAIKYNSVAHLNALNNATFQGFLAGVPDHLKTDLSLRFLQGSEVALNKMADSVEQKNQSDITQAFKVTFGNDLAEYEGAMKGGSKSDQNYTFRRLTDDLNSFAQLQGMPPELKAEFERSISQTTINSSLERGLKESIINGGEEGGSRFILNFLNGDSASSGMSGAQKEEAKEYLLKANTQIRNEMNILSTQGFNNILIESIQNPGSITSLQTLNTKMAEQAQAGFPLNQSQQIQLASKILAKNKAESKRAATNSAINDSVSSGDIDIVNYKNTDINNYWQDSLSAANEHVNTMVAEGKLKEGQIPIWQLEAQAAVNIQRDVPDLTARLDARLTGPNSENLQNGLKQFSFLKTNNPVALSGLDAKTTAFAETILQKSQNVTDSVTLEKIIAEAREGVLDADERVVQQRLDSYASFAKKNPNNVDKKIQQALGLSQGFIFTRGDPIPDIQRAQYNKILESNIPLFEERNRELAFKKTNEEFTRIYSKDPGFAPKGRVVSNSITNLPWSKTTGPMNSNQFAQSVEQIIQLNEKFPGQTGFKLERSKKMPKFPSRLSDTQKIEQKFAPDGHWMKIDGVDRRVYLISPNYSSTNPFAPNAYQMFWGDTGPDGKGTENIRPLTSITSRKLPNGKSVNSMGPALVTIYPPNIYIPDLYKKMQNTQANKDLHAATNAKLDAIEPIRPSDYFMPPSIYDQSTSLTRKIERQKKLGEATKSDIQAKLQEEQKKRDEEGNP